MKKPVRFLEIVPREHGAWAILLFPFFTGAFAEKNPGFPALLLLICIISLYLLRGTMEFYFSLQNKMEQPRDFTRFYLYSFFIISLFLFTASMLLFYYKFWNLLLLGALALFLFSSYYLLVFLKRNSRINQQLTALIGLSLTAPAAYYVTTGKWNSNVFLLWILNIVFLQLGLLYVHNKIGLHKKRKDILSLRSKLLFTKNLMAGWCLSVVVFYFLLLSGLIRPAFFVALLPLTVHIISGIFFHKKELKIKRMGYLQVGQNIVFLIILVYLFRTQGL